MISSYYSDHITKFINESSNSILGSLSRNHTFSLEDTQKNAWLRQIEILQKEFKNFQDGYILFEYSIPRMGKRIDCVFLLNNVIYCLEFKVGENKYPQHAIDQAMDYAVDLKNFHEESHEKAIVPILVSTEASEVKNNFSMSSDRVSNVQMVNKENIFKLISGINEKYFSYYQMDFEKWSNSLYKPTPTIIEAAQALYQGHDVKEISRSDSGAFNLSETSDKILEIINYSKENNIKSICFVTGVPGSGKTLAGLNIANKRNNSEKNQYTVFLSGNQPLVDVLQESLARDEVKRKKIRKKEALQKTKAFIQNIHHFRDDHLDLDRVPIESVAIFDEAQRAWDRKQTSNFMSRKKGKDGFDMSEPEFLISVLDRRKDWAVIICLIGGGQEINKGEAGLPEWFAALSDKFENWDVHISEEITENEYTRNHDLLSKIKEEKLYIDNSLHLSTSVRSFRSEYISKFIKSVLDGNFEISEKLYENFKNLYPIVISRDLDKAKAWLKSKARGSERFGIVSSAGAKRLKPEGIFANSRDLKATNWFLNDKDDIRSSYYLEDIASEFEVQGLELDWVCVAWDANLRFENQWTYYNFKGSKWNKTLNEDIKMYLKNSYRVLLTRARQGMVIFIPKGSNEDHTRPKIYYDGIYNVFKNIGIEEL